MTRVRYHLLSVTLCVISTFGLVAAARASEGVAYGITAGGTFPISSMADVVSGGFNIGVTAYKRMTPLVDLGIDVDAHFLGGTDDFEKQLSATATTPVDYSVTVIPFSFYGRYRVPVDENIQPFLKVGAGVYTLQHKFSIDVLGQDKFENGTKLGLDFGGGVDLQMTPTWILGADLMYHWFDNDPDSGQMIVARVVALFGGTN